MFANPIRCHDRHNATSGAISSHAPSFIAALVVAVALFLGGIQSLYATQVADVPVEPSTPEVDCAALSRDILDTHNGLPDDMSKLTGEALTTVHDAVDRILTRGNEYLENCPVHPDRPEVIHAVTRLMCLNFQRYLLEAQRQGLDVLTARDRYVDRIITLTREGAAATEETALVKKLLQVEGHALYLGARSAEAIGLWQRLIQQHPDDPELDQFRASLVTSMLKASTNAARSGGATDYPAVVRECDIFFAQHPKSSYMPAVINVKWKSLNQAGRLAEAAQFLKEKQQFVTAGMAGALDSEATADDFQRVFEQYGFNIGFCDYASGNAAGAHEAWTRYLEQDLAALERSGKLSQAGTVYKNRTRRLMQTLETIQGKAAPELTPTYWAGLGSTLEAEKGNVVALFFTPYEQSRSEAFARALQQFYQDNWHNGFRAIMVCFPKGKAEGQNQKLSQWLKGMKITYPAMMDNVTKSTHSGFNAAVGSGTIVVVNRKGEVDWYKMDPTERDVSLAASVYNRLLKTSE